jgi:tetratricopeptide (TPR) repeat protein
MLKRDTGFVSDTVVRVEVFPDKSTFAKVSENYSYETLRGLAPVTSKFKRLMFVSPRATLRGYRWREALCREYEYLVTGRVNEIKSEARVVPSSSHGPIFTEDGEIESGSTLQSRYVRLAGKLMKEKRKSAAVKELERAEKAMGGYATSWLLLQLAVLYLENGDDNSALSTIEKAIEQYPDDSNVYFKRAEIYSGKGNAALTIKSARHALEINPFHTYARELLILSLEMTNPASPELNRHKQIAGYLYRYK